jgi:putative CocE/NonD family hydrolase
MSIRTEFPHQVQVIENAWIPLRDGTRLGARLWLPQGAAAAPVPAILEYLPYRKDDGLAQRDAMQYGYFAGHGYACLRVDMRGTGDSDGLLEDEYTQQEQDDGLEVIAWIAAQPWCSGAVGLIGISWSGFNGLQLAARRPPALKAVITLCSTDDRYADDVHYMGGCVLAYDMLPWASAMLAWNALPPDPRFVGDRWRTMWLERMEGTPAYIETWLSHQRRDAYWQHGSVCEDYAAIECPVYAVGGWADGYRNAVLRLLAGLPGPRKGLLGPWSHSFPWNAEPGPSIGFLQVCLRWWDHWLKGRATGIMDEPMLRAWLQEHIAPATTYAERPGRWVAEPTWPSPNLKPRHYALRADGGLGEPDAPAALSHAGTLLSGSDSPVWCPHGSPGDFAPDQRGEDGRALTFTSPPLAEPIDLLGQPEVTVTLSVDRPQALLAARLCAVAPDGASTLVSWGLLNLTHRDSHAQPQPLVPGQPYTVTVRLNATGQRLPAGCRWRLALSPDYWPMAWPSPEPVTLTVHTGGASRLTLPTRPPQPGDAALPAFAPPESAAPPPLEVTRTGRRERTFQRDIVTGKLVSTSVADDGGVRFLDNGEVMDAALVDTYTIYEGQPLTAHVQSDWRLALSRGDWRVRIETRSIMTCDAHSFHVTNTLGAFEGEARIYARTWSQRIPRDCV